MIRAPGHTFRLRGIHVADDVFQRFLEARTRHVAAPELLRTDDLYLACACIQGDPIAIAAFVAEHFPAARQGLERAGLPEWVVDEVMADLPAQLFAPCDGSGGALIGYSGRGGIRAWTKSVALRTALKLARRTRRMMPMPDDEATASVLDPELLHLREAYASRVKTALASAFAALDPGERAVLRQYYVHRLTIDDLGRLYRIHRVSAARRIKRAREVLVAAARARLQEVMGDEVGLESALALAGSRLSLEGILERSSG